MSVFDSTKSLRQNIRLINTEITTINTNLTSLNTSAASGSGSSTHYFLSTCEAEGTLTINTFPFSFGMGTTSTPQFGLPIPFNYKVLKIFYSSFFTTANIPIIKITLTNHPLDSSTLNLINQDEITFSSRGSIHTFVNPAENLAGNLGIRIDSVNNLSEDCKFRISILYSTQDTL